MTKEEALRLAREHIEGNYTVSADEALAAIKEVLAQPEQEPVAFMFQHDEVKRCVFVPNDSKDPVGTFLQLNPRYRLVGPLYTTPPQRKPLTDEQRMEMWRTTKFRGNGGQVDWFIEGTRAAEAAHGIKEKA